MSAARKIWAISWRTGVAFILLGWIFHSIFLNEGRLVWQRGGHDWSALDRWGQWKVAWSNGPPELWRTLCLIPATAFLGSVLLMGATIVLGFWRWHLVLEVQGLKLSVARTAGISLVAHFFNSLLLGSTGGDLMKAYYAARETHHRKTEAVVTVVVDRLIGLWAMLLFAMVMVLPSGALFLRYRRLEAMALTVLAMLVASSGILALGFWGGVSKRFPRARDLLRRLPKGEAVERAVVACRQFGESRAFVFKTAALSMLLNAVCVAQFLTIARGLGLEISARVLFAIVPMIICISALPVTPSGLGVRENLFVLALAIPEIGVPATSALSLSLLAYAGSLIWSLIGGVVYLFLKKRELLDEVTGGNGAEEGA